MIDWSSQTAVVTGASSGIGKAIALALAAQGAAVALVGRNAQRLKLAAEAARDTACRVAVYQTDLGSDENIHELRTRLEREFPSIDILIHSAGVISIGAVERAAIEEFDHQYRVNLRAPYLLTQALLPMLRKGPGQVVFMNSLVGLIAKGNSAQYSATKHALKALADSLRQEVNPQGIRVMSVFLGRTASPLQAALRCMEERTYTPELLVQPEDVATVVVSALGISRSAEVTDITLRHAFKVD
jgi:short-subunit dehydrogenase